MLPPVALGSAGAARRGQRAEPRKQHETEAKSGHVAPGEHPGTLRWCPLHEGPRARGRTIGPGTGDLNPMEPMVVAPTAHVGRAGVPTLTGMMGRRWRRRLFGGAIAVVVAAAVATVLAIPFLVQARNSADAVTAYVEESIPPPDPSVPIGARAPACARRLPGRLQLQPGHDPGRHRRLDGRERAAAADRELVPAVAERGAPLPPRLGPAGGPRGRDPDDHLGALERPGGREARGDPARHQPAAHRRRARRTATSAPGRAGSRPTRRR